METEPQPNPIAQLNDAFRQGNQGWYMTPGIQALEDVPGLLTLSLVGFLGKEEK